MARDTRSPVEIPLPPGWRAHVDQRKARPGEHAIRGLDADYLEEGLGRVMVTTVLASTDDPVVAAIVLLERALEALKSSTGLSHNLPPKSA